MCLCLQQALPRASFWTESSSFPDFCIAELLPTKYLLSQSTAVRWFLPVARVERVFTIGEFYGRWIRMGRNESRHIIHRLEFQQLTAKRNLGQSFIKFYCIVLIIKWHINQPDFGVVGFSLGLVRLEKHSSECSDVPYKWIWKRIYQIFSFARWNYHVLKHV